MDRGEALKEQQLISDENLLKEGDILIYRIFYEHEAEKEELELKVKEYERLHGELNDILHPNGDKPSNPSLCDLVAYVQEDLKDLNHKLKNGRERYEANLMSMEDCSKITTRQALEIKELKEEKEDV